MLNCHCTSDFEECEDELANFSFRAAVSYCKSAAMCYVARELVGGDIVWIRGCRDNSSSKSCHSKRHDHAFVTECCTSSDFCNNDTMIEAIDKKYPLMDRDALSPNVAASPDVSLVCISAAIFVVFFILLALLLMVLVRRTRTRNHRSTFASTVSSNCSFIETTHLSKRFVDRVAYTCYCWCGEKRSLDSNVQVIYQRAKLNSSSTNNAGDAVANKGLTVDSEFSTFIPTQQTYLEGNHDECTFSGSGSGQVLLVPQTIARTIRLIDVIGRGRYGEVWKGELGSELVAVKIFPSREEASWERESYVFNQARLRHESVVNFLAADVFGRGSTTELWLIMAYYENGALFDYLSKNTLDMRILLRFAYSAARGLHYLHSTIGLKPAMAHRDLKTKNLLIKDDFSLCLADFGLVAIEGVERGSNNEKVGTRRYMAPEVLELLRHNENILPFENDFSNFLRADMYSFGLILWEMISRSRLANSSAVGSDYFPPYYDMLPPEPSLEEMYKLVVDDEARPKLPKHLSMISLQANEIQKDRSANTTEAQILRSLWLMTCESWSPIPTDRPAALMLKKGLHGLQNTYKDMITHQ